MASPIADILPPDIETAVREAVSRDLPDRSIGGIRVCEASQNHYVVRVLLPVPKLKPSPYRVYKVEVPSLRVGRLEGEDAKPYRIPNYK